MFFGIFPVDGSQVAPAFIKRRAGNEDLREFVGLNGSKRLAGNHGVSGKVDGPRGPLEAIYRREGLAES